MKKINVPKIVFNNDKNAKIKLKLKEILYNSLSQAFIVIYETPYQIQKLFLLLSVISTISLSSYFVIGACMNYFEYQVVTSTRFFFEYPALFPQITICNNSPFTTKYAYDYLLKLNFNTNLSLTDLTFESLAIQYMNTLLPDSEKKKLGHNLEDILFECKFNFQLCNSSDFTRIFDPERGNCFMFNNDSSFPKKLFSTGTKGGLKLKLYANFYQKLNLFNSNYGGLGLILKIKNSTFNTANPLEVKISSGFDSNVAIKRSFRSKMPKPYSNCEIINGLPNEHDSKLYKLIAKSKYKYTKIFCVSQLYQNLSLEKCNCTNPWSESVLPGNVCNDANDLICSFSLFSKFLSNESYLNYNDCPLECYDNEYEVSVSSFKLIGDFFIEKIKNTSNLRSDFLNKDIDLNDIGESFIVVNIFYDSLGYILSNESPSMNLVTLFASIGGNLSLFLGINLFSICEIIEVMIEIYFIKKSK